MWTDEVKMCYVKIKYLGIRTSQKPDATGEGCGKSWKFKITKIKFIWY
jgi:hypothetical protein